MINLGDGLHIGVDFDDTIWHTSPHFRRAHGIVLAILDGHLPVDDPAQWLRQVDHDRVNSHGYGVASFALAVLEAAAREAPDFRLECFERLFVWVSDVRHGPLEMIEDAAMAIVALARLGSLIGITRGNIGHQRDLFMASGVSDSFRDVEIVAEKSVDVYRRILARHQISSSRFVMIGDSLVGDAVTAVEVGGYGIHVPYHGGSWEANVDRGARYLAAAETGRLFEAPSLSAAVPIVASLFERTS